jgi:hypothetical protein
VRLRARSDRKLAEPYRSWIDRRVPLPDGVRLLPRTIDVGSDALIFLMLGGMMGGMGVVIASLMPPWQLQVARSGWGPPLLLGAICLGLWSVPLLLLRRLIHTLGAAADQRRGALRQGVLVGAEGLLVRMEPGRCHPIAAEQFVAARLFPPKASQDRRKPTLIVETREGIYRFLALRLWYRCPQCRGKPVRAFEALPDVHFYCRACNVEWATGLKELADQS